MMIDDILKRYGHKYESEFIFKKYFALFRGNKVYKIMVDMDKETHLFQLQYINNSYIKVHFVLTKRELETFKVINNTTPVIFGKLSELEEELYKKLETAHLALINKIMEVEE